MCQHTPKSYIHILSVSIVNISGMDQSSPKTLYRNSMRAFLYLKIKKSFFFFTFCFLIYNFKLKDPQMFLRRRIFGKRLICTDF